MEKKQEGYRLPMRFFIQVKEGWYLGKSGLNVGDVLLVEPYEDPKLGGLHFFRIGGPQVCIGWLYEHEEQLMFYSIFGEPRNMNISEFMMMAKREGIDYAIYPITNKVRLKTSGDAVNDPESKGGDE